MRDPDYNYERHTDVDVSTQPEVNMLQETFMDKTYDRPGDGSDYVPPNPNIEVDMPGGEPVEACGVKVKIVIGFTELTVYCDLLPHDERIKHRVRSLLTGINGERITLVWG